MLKAHNSAAGTGQEGAIEMLNSKGTVLGRPWRGSGTLRLNLSSNRSFNLYLLYLPSTVPVGTVQT